MKTNWGVYPDNIGDRTWPGCFRCHDGAHKTEDGKPTIKANDCDACHPILAQGNGSELEQLTAADKYSSIRRVFTIRPSCALIATSEVRE